MVLTSKISATFGLSYKENSSFSPDPRMGEQSEELVLSPVFTFHLKTKSLSIQTEFASDLGGGWKSCPEGAVPSPA